MTLIIIFSDTMCRSSCPNLILSLVIVLIMTPSNDAYPGSSLRFSRDMRGNMMYNVADTGIKNYNFNGEMTKN